MGSNSLNDARLVERALSEIEKVGVDASLERYRVLAEQIHSKLYEIKVDPGSADARLEELLLALEQGVICWQEAAPLTSLSCEIAGCSTARLRRSDAPPGLTAAAGAIW